MSFLDRRQMENISGMDPEIERRFRTILSGQDPARGTGSEFCPAADVILERNRMVIIIGLAGIQRDDIQLGVTDQELVLRGTRHEPVHLEKEQYINMELNFGPFERRFPIQPDLDMDGIEANYSDGFLIIRIPRVPNKNVTLNVKGSEEE